MEGSTIIINAEKLERRVALLENGVLEEYTIEREGEDNIVGGIFKGRVKNIEPGLKAMFVDIGQEKNAFLHFWDALPAALELAEKYQVEMPIVQTVNAVVNKGMSAAEAVRSLMDRDPKNELPQSYEK